MRVALTGGTGFIGGHICRRLTESGHTITLLVRESSDREPVSEFVDRFVVGEQHDEIAWDELLRDADAVIHNAVEWKTLRGLGTMPDFETFQRHIKTNLVGSLELLRRSAPLPFVFMSSIAVHHDMRSRWQGRPDEDHPMRPSNAYGAYKAAVESHLWAEHFAAGRHTAAIRPCAVYGIDNDITRSHGYLTISDILDEKPLNREGGGKYVHVEDVASATVAALERSDASGQPFNLTDCYMRYADWASLACEVMGVERQIDFSSPEAPKNTFSKESTRTILGVDASRGRDGIREHLRELLPLVKAERAAR